VEVAGGDRCWGAWREGCGVGGVLAWLVGATVGAALTERTGCDAAVKVAVDVPARVVGEAGDGPDPDFEFGGHPDVGSGPAFVDPDVYRGFRGCRGPGRPPQTPWFSCRFCDG